MKPPRFSFLADLQDWWSRGSRATCPYCKQGFNLKQWRERDRETGGHDPCPTA